MKELEIQKEIISIENINELSKILNISSYQLYKFSNLKNFYYKTLLIEKKSNGYRKICAPSNNLKIIQKWILENILYKVKIDSHCNGFTPNKSIVTNAMPHLNQNIVYNLDLKDFFPSIKINRVYRVFKEIGYNKEMCALLSNLCTYEGCLPQGAVTSPFLSNIISKRLDLRLKGLAQKMSLNYTRYADDLTFSGDKINEKTQSLIKRIIKSEGFEVNLKKERIRKRHERQEVTGLIVNGELLNTPRKYENYLRQQIYYINKFGVFNSLLFQEKEEVSNYRDHLYGVAYYMKMVNTCKGEKYLLQLDLLDWQS